MIHRRVLAGSIDAALIALPAIVAAITLAERFPFERDGDGSPQFAIADQQRINQIDEGFSRAISLGHSLFTLSGGGWWSTVAVLVLATLVVLFVVPTAFGGRSPGQLLLGLAAAAPEISEPPIVMERSDPLTEENVGDTRYRPSPHRETDDRRVDLQAGQTSHEDHGEGAELGEVDRGERQHGDGHGGGLPGAWRLSPVEGIELSEPATEDVGAVGEAEEGPPDAGTELDFTDGAGVQRATLADDGEYSIWDDQFGAMELEQASGPDRGGAGFEELALPESSLSETPLTATTLVQARPTMEAPLWSEEWAAWLFWDPATDRWFRHDETAGRWVPLR